MPGPDTGPLGSAAYTVGAALDLLRLRPDLIHVHDLLSPSTAALLATRLRPVPVVAKVLSTGPGGDVDRLLHKPGGARRLHRIGDRFAAFACLSHEVEDELAAHGVPRGRCRRIANGVDTTVFRPARDAAERRAAREALGIPVDDEPLWLSYGRFADVKRLDVLIDALAAAPGRLLLVGEGPLEARLREQAAGLGDRIVIRPVVDDTAPLCRAADAYLSASSTEGMSGAVLEAMAAGLPVVAAPASGMDALLGDGAGVLLDGGDAPAFTTALRELAADRGRGAALGARARARAERDFSLARTADLLTALYRELAG
jgi:glycosyltransferase involved in cell wall biosynthesis